ncbi:MAG: RICIN domain-containing protein [Atopobiaceae bacterium]
MITAAVTLLVILTVVVVWQAHNTAQETPVQTEDAATEPEVATPNELQGIQAGTYYLEVTDNDGAVLAATGNENDDYTTVRIASQGSDAPTEQITLAVVDEETCTLTFANGLALDGGDPSAPAGQHLYATQPSDSDSQRWILERNDNGSYTIVNKATGYAIEASDIYVSSYVVTDTVDQTDYYQRFTFVATTAAKTSMTAQGGGTSA